MPEDDDREYRIVPEELWKGLDPDLQHVVLDRQARPAGQPAPGKDSTGEAEVIDVIAKLRDPKVKVNGLNVVEEIGHIVTGTVDADRVEAVRRHPNVISLKGARGLRQTLSNSVPEIRASRHQLLTAFPSDPKPLDGSNVIVGIIDHRCDFAHPNFRKPDASTPGGATRVLYLWDQRGGPYDNLPAGRGRSPGPYGYGREFNSDAINDALRKAPPTPQCPAAPHKYLGYDITGSTHGTGVMDIAAGNGGGRFAPGVAPGADIIFVDQSSEDYYMSGGSSGDSRRMLEAVRYVFRKAQELGRPAVVNISMNHDGGPHDGSTLVEQGFDRLLETPGRAIVIAAGNSRIRQIHARRMLHPSRTHTLRWETFPDEINRNKLDLWYSGDRALSLTLRSPRGEEIGPFPLDSTYTIYRQDGARAGFVFHRANDPNNLDNNLVILFTPLMEAGVWELDLYLLDDGSHLPIEVHAWTETDQQPSQFPGGPATDSASTLGSLGCGISTIVTGAYSPLNPSAKLPISGEGPTRDGRLKPEVSAPGTQLLVAQPLSSFTQEFEGTSAAAPHVAGLIALLMQSAAAPLSIDQIREFVINTTRDRPPSPENGWDTCYGAGRIDAVAAVRAQRDAAQALSAAIAPQPLVVSPNVSQPAANGDGGAKHAVAGSDLAARDGAKSTSPPPEFADKV